MSLRRSPLFRAVEPAIVGSGLQPDLHKVLSILWADARNVSFQNGRVRRRRGNTLVVDLGDGDIRGLSQQQDSNGVRWIWGAVAGQVKRWYGPAAEAIYTFVTHRQDETASYPASFIDFVHYGDWTVLSNGIEAPRLHKPAGQAVFGNAPVAAKFMKKLSFIVALGTGAAGTRVQWSDSSNIEDWTPTQSNNAGGLSFDDFNTRIVAAAPLGAQIAVFAEDQMGLLSYIGAPFYFSQKTALDGIGAVGKNAVASDGKSIFGVGRAGIWWTDGNSFRYIDEGYLHDYLQDNVNWLQKSKISAVRNDYTGCFEFFFPMLGSNSINEGWSFDPRTGGWAPVPAVPLKDERRLFQYPLAGTDATGTVQYDNSDPAAVTPLTLRTKPLLMQMQQASSVEDVHEDVFIDEFDLLVKAATSVEVRIGSSQDMNGAVSWSSWQAVTPDSKTYKVAKVPSGAYWQLDFRSTADAWTLDLQGFLLFGQVEGTKRGSSRP